MENNGGLTYSAPVRFLGSGQRFWSKDNLVQRLAARPPALGAEVDLFIDRLFSAVFRVGGQTDLLAPEAGLSFPPGSF